MKPYSVYIAAPYIARDGLRHFAAELAAVGMKCTSQWLLGETDIQTGIGAATAESAETIRAAAQSDLSHVDHADALVQFTGLAIEGLRIPEAVGPTLHSGGRHVELGYALARGKSVIVIGPAENIFQRTLCTSATNWHEAFIELVRLRDAKEYALDGAA